MHIPPKGVELCIFGKPPGLRVTEGIMSDRDMEDLNVVYFLENIR